MIKKTFLLFMVAVLLTGAFASNAAAADSKGETIFMDSMYGALIGGIAGLALYATDDDQLGDKVGGGVIIGALLGLGFGVYETTSVAEYRDGKMYVGVPLPQVEVRKDETIYKVTLFKAEF